jgi:hypothetical protein
MKLFRMAFWLGVVIYNLPSTVTTSNGPASHNASQGSVAKAAPQSCLQPFESCAKTVEAPNKRGESGGQSYSRNPVKPPQDTLSPADRRVPWRAPAQSKGPVVVATISNCSSERES